MSICTAPVSLRPGGEADSRKLPSVRGLARIQTRRRNDTEAPICELKATLRKRGNSNPAIPLSFRLQEIGREKQSPHSTRKWKPCPFVISSIPLAQQAVCRFGMYIFFISARRRRYKGRDMLRNISSTRSFPTMFARISAFSLAILALPLVASSAVPKAGTNTTVTGGECNTGSAQCCKSVQDVSCSVFLSFSQGIPLIVAYPQPKSDAVQSALGLLGIPIGDITANV